MNSTSAAFPPPGLGQKTGGLQSHSLHICEMGIRLPHPPHTAPTRGLLQRLHEVECTRCLVLGSLCMLIHSPLVVTTSPQRSTCPPNSEMPSLRRLLPFEAFPGAAGGGPRWRTVPASKQLCSLPCLACFTSAVRARRGRSGPAPSSQPKHPWLPCPAPLTEPGQQAPLQASQLLLQVFLGHLTTGF